MKKYVVLTLCLLLVVLAAVPAFAAEDTKITVTASKTVVQRGDTVDVTISVSGTTPLTSIVLIPAFDAECFEFVSAVANANLSGFIVDQYTPGNPISLLGLNAGTPVGVIQTITLKVKDAAPIKSYNITHEPNGLSVKNASTPVAVALRA